MKPTSTGVVSRGRNPLVMLNASQKQATVWRLPSPGLLAVRADRPSRSTRALNYRSWAKRFQSWRLNAIDLLAKQNVFWRVITTFILKEGFGQQWVLLNLWFLWTGWAIPWRHAVEMKCLSKSNAFCGIYFWKPFSDFFSTTCHVTRVATWHFLN